MRHLRLLFEDVMQKNILYYDKTNIPACMNICNELKINNLPTIPGNYYFEYSDGEFSKRKVTHKYKTDCMTPVFSEKAVRQISNANNNVLFVYEGNVLKGLIHISDYNRDIVIQYIQDDVLSFERLLRQWLVLNGFKSHDMVDYYHYKLRKSKGSRHKQRYSERLEEFKGRMSEINALGEFQTFDFSEILQFAASDFTSRVHRVQHSQSQSSASKDPIHMLVQLRNMAMHGKNPVYKDKSAAVYSTSSLIDLVESLNLLRFEYASLSKKVRSHTHFQKAIELENRFKLEIIHDHHPRALEYFLGA